MFRLIIAGTRTFNDYAMLRAYCDMKLSRKIAQGEEIEIVSGGCPPGAERNGAFPSAVFQQIGSSMESAPGRFVIVKWRNMEML